MKLTSKKSITTNLDSITSNLESCLTHHSNVIVINNQKYQEFINYHYHLNRNNLPYLICEQYIPNNVLDVEEREDILNFFQTFDFKSDMNTRQAVFQAKYKEDATKAACIPCIHVLFRNGLIYVNIYMRSSNYDQNWWYDQQTFALLMNTLMNQYDLEFGDICISIGSLHRPIISK